MTERTRLSASASTQAKESAAPVSNRGRGGSAGGRGGGDSAGAKTWEAQRSAQQRFQASVAAKNEKVFAAERAERAKMREQAAALRATPGEALRLHLPQLRDKSDAEILAVADALEARADSHHPLPGFWDGMGHPIHPASGDKGGSGSGSDSGGGDIEETGVGNEEEDEGDNDDGEEEKAKGAGLGATLDELVAQKRAALLGEAALLRSWGPEATRKQVPHVPVFLRTCALCVCVCARACVRVRGPPESASVEFGCADMA